MGVLSVSLIGFLFFRESIHSKAKPGWENVIREWRAQGNSCTSQAAMEFLRLTKLMAT